MLFADMVKALGGADPIPATNHDVLWTTLINQAGVVVLALIGLATLYLQYKNKTKLAQNFTSLTDGQTAQQQAIDQNTMITRQGTGAALQAAALSSTANKVLADQSKALGQAKEEIKDAITEATK